MNEVRDIDRARTAYLRVLRASKPALISDDVVPLVRLLRRRAQGRAADVVEKLRSHLQGPPMPLEAEAEGLLQALRYVWGLDGATLLVELLAAALPHRQLGLFG